MFSYYAQQLLGDVGFSALRTIGLLAPFWLPILLGFVFYNFWIDYIHRKFFSSQKYSLLEIKLPKDIFKSPVAMELFLASLHQTGGEGTWWDRNVNGRTRPWFSLEMISDKGNVRYFIWTRAAFKPLVESGLYSQFPGIEITDVPDYTSEIHPELGKWGIWGCHFALTKADCYPIKTYVDYGLDKDPKEELKNDPITPLLEFLGSITSAERVWIQIIVRAHKADPDPWKDEAKKEITKIRKEATPDMGDPDKIGFPNPTKGQVDTISALERSVSKYGYDVGIRGMYVVDEGNFKVVRISSLTGAFKQFGSLSLNGFKPTGGHAIFNNFPWEDRSGKKRKKVDKAMIKAYKKRAYFFETPKLADSKSFVLNSEELATIFHFPGRVAGTPTLGRVQSRKAEPPSNLPV